MAAAVIEDITDEPETIKVGGERSRYVWNPQLDTEHFAVSEPDSTFKPPPYWESTPTMSLGTNPSHPCNATQDTILSKRCAAQRNAMELTTWLLEEMGDPVYKPKGEQKYQIQWKRESVELHRPSPDGRLRIDHELGEVQPEEISRAEAILELKDTWDEYRHLGFIPTEAQGLPQSRTGSKHFRASMPRPSLCRLRPVSRQPLSPPS